MQDGESRENSILLSLSEEKNTLVKTLAGYFKDRQEIAFAYLFGSYASGSNNRFSDVDIAIYFIRDELSKDIDKYLNMKMELTELLKTDVDLIILNTANPLLKSRIINMQVKIFSRDTLLESEFALRSLNEYFDVKPYLDMQYRKVISQMNEVLPDG